MTTWTTQGRPFHTASLTALLVGGCAVPPTPLGLSTEASSTGSGLSSSTSSPVSDTVTSSGPLESSGPATTTEASETTSELSAGSTSMSTSTGPGDTETTGGGLMCAMGLVDCGGTCIDPDSSFDYCGASAPCAGNPGAVCDPLLEICSLGTCTDCELRYDFEGGPAQVNSWSPGGTWGLAGATPVTTNPSVSFDSTVYGVTGQDMGFNETSQVIATPIPYRDTLCFRSWHVDRGGLAGQDNKTIGLRIGGRVLDPLLVDCAGGINDTLPLCAFEMGPRDRSDWDHIVLDTSPLAGANAELFLGYDAGGVQIGFEQGWYIDDIRTGDDCGPPT